ncbi:MAG: DUF72 domain-containing protein [Candidatus Aenigmatarchaeota archaeon]
MIKVGCCGWGFLRPRDFLGNKANKFKSVLQAYSSIFPCVEVNSTFYKIPKVNTAEKWSNEAKEIKKDFEFSVKCNQLITHQIKFSKGSVNLFNMMKEICKALKARILLFQSPASFKASEENIKRMEDFFKLIKRENLILAWEPRGEWHKNPELIKKICKKFDLVECVDPFRNEPIYFGKDKITYFRLHGFGLISMYNYNFSEKELVELKEKVEQAEKKAKEIWVMFNNSMMYKNALEFIKLIKEK